MPRDWVRFFRRPERLGRALIDVIARTRGALTVTPGGGGGGDGWLAHLPSGATLFDQIHFGLTPIYTDNVMHITGENGIIQTRTPNWTRVAGADGYWQVTKPAGSGGGGSTDWGDFYALTTYPRNRWYICVERMFGDDFGLGYEWHSVSNKDQNFDSSGPTQVLFQTYESGAYSPWQAPEALWPPTNPPGGYHPATTQVPITSNVKHVFEYIVQYGTDQRLATWRDGTLLIDVDPRLVPDPVTGAVTNLVDPGQNGYLEYFLHHFDGGGAYLRQRTSWIRYYRLAIYRF